MLNSGYSSVAVRHATSHKLGHELERQHSKRYQVINFFHLHLDFRLKLPVTYLLDSLGNGCIVQHRSHFIVFQLPDTVV